MPGELVRSKPPESLRAVLFFEGSPAMFPNLPSLSTLSPQHALTVPAVAAINHLLAQEAWASR
jgi:hypothetical protein